MMLDLAQSLGNKSNLTTIGLEYNRIRSRGANHIFKAVRALPKFERLFLSHNLLTDESAEPVQELLADSLSLKEIRLNNNSQIGDDAGKLMIVGLQKSTSIRVFHASDTKLSGLSAAGLCEIIR